MKNIVIVLGAILIMAFGSCKRMTATYETRLAGVKAVCPNCTFVTSECQFYAQDTSKQPNIVYKVYFKNGGMFYTASDVDHLVRIN